MLAQFDVKVGSVGNKNMISDFNKDMKMAKESSDALNASMQSLAVNGIAAAATAMGQMIAGGGGMAGFLDSLVLMVADTAEALGKQFITMGVAALAVTTQLFTNPVGAIAAGAALVAAGAAAKQIMANHAKKTPKLADGGIAYGNSIVNVGEYAGANANPEVIAPLNKLESILGNRRGGGSQELYSHVYGSQLIMVTSKSAGNYRRINGRR
jgi:hypothetical protein